MLIYNIYIIYCMIQLINMLGLLINKCFIIINYYFNNNKTHKNLVKVNNDIPNYNNLENDWQQFVELD